MHSDIKNYWKRKTIKKNIAWSSQGLWDSSVCLGFSHVAGAYPIKLYRPEQTEQDRINMIARLRERFNVDIVTHDYAQLSREPSRPRSVQKVPRDYMPKS